MSVSPPYGPDLTPCKFWLFPKLKSPLKERRFVSAVHKLSQPCYTAIWLAPWESDCLRMYSKVSSDWLPSYMKATHLVLKIFKMAGYFMDRPHIHFKTLHLMGPYSLGVTHEVFQPNETMGNICFLDRN
jgi:hypothetical protein